MKIKAFFFGLVVILGAFSAASKNPHAEQPAPSTIALLFDIGGRGDNGFNDSAYRGMEKAASELGIKAIYIEQDRPLERDHALKKAVTSDAEMIIGVGFAFSEKLNLLAQQYPDKKFVCIDYSPSHSDTFRTAPMPDNLAGIAFREEEGSYLVGMLAARMSKTESIGFIGGMESAIIRKFQAGFLAGAQAVKPDIHVLSKYTGITGIAFNDPEKGYRIASDMYGQGADIIFHASGATGAGIIRAAKERNRFVIGVDVDQSAQAPGHVLTSMIKKIDVAVFETVRSWKEDNFSGGLKTFGLKEKGVGWIYNDGNRRLIPDNVHKQILAVEAKISAGELAVPAVIDHKPMFSREELQDLLMHLKTEITEVLTRLDSMLQQSAEALTGEDLTGDAALDILKKIYEDNPYIIDCETVSSQGIMLAVEPADHRASEGADISKQAHMVKLFSTRQPVLSGSLRSVEGPQAVVIHHPVFSASREFRGSVAALFAPEYMLSGIICPVSSNLPVTVFLMQTDGLIIYDADPDQIGLNLFTDPMYKPFPKLVDLGRKMASSDDGADSYEFYMKHAELPVTKIVYWQTVILHGTPWRIAVACASDNVENY